MRRRRGFDPSVILLVLVAIIAIAVLVGWTLVARFGWVHP